MALKCRMRLYETRHISRFVNSNKNVPMGVIAGKCKLLEILMNGTSTAGSEIDPVTNKMQLTVADLMEYKSAQDNDKDLAIGGHVRAFNAIVVDANNEPKNLECRMAALGTTLVHTAEKLLDCWHINAIDWGDGDDDAAGQIDMEKEDSTAISSIAGAANEGNGSGFLIPAGWKACLLEGRLEAVGAQGAAEGVVLTMNINDAIDLATTVNVLNSISWQIHGSDRTVKLDCNRIFQAGTEITFNQAWIVGAGEDFHVRLYFLLWEA